MPSEKKRLQLTKRLDASGSYQAAGESQTTRACAWVCVCATAQCLGPTGYTRVAVSSELIFTYCLVVG
jgi:hypothetical protein